MKKANIEAFDFDLLYRLQREASSYKKKDSTQWDKKALEMNQKIHEGSYNDQFLNSVKLENVKSILDVGCGPGTFALKFAKKVEQVYALDFSIKMLEVLEDNAKEQNLKNIKTFCFDLQKPWQDVPKADIVIASRCLEVENIKEVLEKLNDYANRAVYLTFKVGGSFLNQKVLDVIGKDIVPRPDYIYLLNILYSLGITANVKFIDTPNCCSNIKSEDDYIDSITWSLDGVDEIEEKKARAYYQECLKNGTTPAHRNNKWAFIWWEK